MSKFKTMIEEIENKPNNPQTKPNKYLKFVRIPTIATISLVVGILASLSYLFLVAKDVKLRTPIQSPLYFEVETAPVPLDQHHPKEPSRQ